MPEGIAGDGGWRNRVYAGPTMSLPDDDARSDLSTAPPPPEPGDRVGPDVIETYVRAAMHSDRRPGTVLAICHPLRMYKVPRRLLAILEHRGHDVQVVETLPDRVASVAGIRDALVEARSAGKPLDVLVFSGDGSLDHHVLVAAYWAFYPELVEEKKGLIAVEEPTPEEWRTVPDPIREAFVSPIPDPGDLAPTEANIQRIWVIRRRIERAVRAGRSPRRIAARAGLEPSDPRLRLAVFATLFPHRLRLRAHGFDLSGLAEATQAQAFQGLYPFVRSIGVYPAGTAADNALYAGIPGYAYAQAVRWLERLGLDSLRDRWEESTLQRFLEVFEGGVVVPGRFSIIAFDGEWSVLSSHAAGGPGGGSFFAADLESKTGGLLGYLARIPGMIWFDGFFGTTHIKVAAHDVNGQVRTEHRGRLVEALYTNRAFIAGVGSVPSTNPTGFAGQSSLVVAPPLWYRDADDRFVLDASGLLTFSEAIVKGVLGRLMHTVGLGVGRLAGGGRFWFAAPEHQITLQEGESCHMDFLGPEGRPRAVATQVSGDPFQAWKMAVRVGWGPLPLLAAPDSLLMAAAQRSLSRLREAQGFQLRTVYIAGLAWFRHLVGGEWNREMVRQTGLVMAPRTLPRRLGKAQRQLLRMWERQDAGPFIDTTEQGVALGRRGRYAHNSERTAHLVLLRESGTLLVRQVRRMADAIYEARTTYRSWWGGWVVHDSQVRRWEPGQQATIEQEEHYFRDATTFRAEAPSFFPFVGDGPTYGDMTDEVPRPVQASGESDASPEPGRAAVRDARQSEGGP